ncbi:hypothetical protein HNQ87_001030 [Pacificimonas flava]|nr:hypothetical protein [Pacificimonas flava]
MSPARGLADHMGRPGHIRKGRLSYADDFVALTRSLQEIPSLIMVADFAVAILPFVLIGFAAQLVDGALGMAFGVISSTLLIGFGVPPAAASAGVHLAECVTTGLSGLGHALHRNIDWGLFRRLVLPGLIGGAAGAYLLSSLDASTVKPFVLAYLLIVGIVLLVRALCYPPTPKRPRFVAPIGFAGGFLDAAGGGGWGPVVTSNLLIQGTSPRTTIGTVNSAEFFLTVTISVTFILSLGMAAFTTATLGLILGGALAAPLGPVAARHLPARLLLILAGAVIIGTSAYGIWRAFG